MSDSVADEEERTTDPKDVHYSLGPNAAFVAEWPGPEVNAARQEMYEIKRRLWRLEYPLRDLKAEADAD